MIPKINVILFSLVVGLLGIYLYEVYQSNEMSYKAWKAANSALNLSGKNVLVVGGTQGIGAGVAIRFSQLGSSVAIAGRNETLAKEVISEMNDNKKFETQEFKFFKMDASLIEDLDKFTTEVKQYYEPKGGINYLVQTQGVINHPSPTSEGLDRGFVINCYSKWFITERLISLLKESNIYIYSPASGGSLDLNDIELKNYGGVFGDLGKMGALSKRDGNYIDAITKEFQERNPSLRFSHLGPGLVTTNVMSNNGWHPAVIWGLKMVFWTLPLGRTSIEFSDYPVYVATQWKDGGYSMNQNAKRFAPYDYVENSENRSKLWEWNENVAHRFLKK